MNIRVLQEIAKILVHRVQEGQLIKYGELSRTLECKGILIPSDLLGNPLGQISRRCSDIGLPLLSAIVVNADTGIPGTGFFQAFFPEAAPSEWETLWTREIQSCFDCEKWDELLVELGIAIVKAPDCQNRDTMERNKERGANVSDHELDLDGDVDDFDVALELEEDDLEDVNFQAATELLEAATRSSGRHGMAGESHGHRQLKEMLVRSPASIGLPSDMVGSLEYRFPSGDCVDVLFAGPSSYAAVEVELRGEVETLIGLFQAVKYKALLQAELAIKNDERAVESFLVANEVPSSVKNMAAQLHIRVVEVP